MAYTPTTWVSGDTITAAKMNKLEQGVSDASSSGGVLIVHNTQSTELNTTINTLDKTWQEIHDASLTGLVVLIGDVDTSPWFGYIDYIGSEYVETQSAISSSFRITFFGGSWSETYSTSSANGYPTYTYTIQDQSNPV